MINKVHAILRNQFVEHCSTLNHYYLSVHVYQGSIEIATDEGRCVISQDTVNNLSPIIGILVKKIEGAFFAPLHCNKGYNYKCLYMHILPFKLDTLVNTGLEKLALRSN